MLITTDTLIAAGAVANCAALRTFAEYWPDGAEPTTDNMIEAVAVGLNPLWLACLLPTEGPVSQRALRLYCADQCAAPDDDARVVACRETVRRRVDDPASVSDEDLAAAAAAAWAAWSAAWTAAAAAAWAAWTAAWTAAVPAAGTAARWSIRRRHGEEAEAAAYEEQLAYLAALLCDTEAPR